MRLLLLALVAAAALACDVPCVWPAAHWRAHPQDPAWAAVAGASLCGSSYADALASGSDAAAQIVAASLNMAVATAAQACVPNATEAFLRVGAVLAAGCQLPAPADVAALTEWNSGAAGPCRCGALACARVVAPQTVIDKQAAAIDSLSAAAVGFLVWAVVATVAAVALVVVLAWLHWPEFSALSLLSDDGADADVPLIAV
jgi:hypothetical protein